MKANPHPGAFIVFEGLDGSGQSTQVDILRGFLRERDIPVHITKEPTPSLIGGIIRSQLWHDWKSSQECLQLLFSADRAYHLEKEITPLLEQGVTVISDRYVLSTIAYGAIDITDVDWLFEINRSFLIPDLTFYLDVSPAECVKRMQDDRFGIELFEKEQTLQRVADNYADLFPRMENVHIIDGERAPRDIAADVQHITTQTLQTKYQGKLV